jgi:thiol-disulfide isomerase/thioredoxin
MYSSTDGIPKDATPIQQLSNSNVTLSQDCSVQVYDIIKKYDEELTLQKQQIQQLQQQLLDQQKQQQDFLDQQKKELEYQTVQKNIYQNLEKLLDKVQNYGKNFENYAQQVQTQQQPQAQQQQPQAQQQQPQVQQVQNQIGPFSSFISEVTEDTLAFIQAGPTIMLFYAPWCVHCVHFKPVYEQIAKMCLDKKLSVRFAVIDGSKFPKIVQDYKLKGYPTIGLIRNSEFTMYNGPRTDTDIMSWIEKI